MFRIQTPGPVASTSMLPYGQGYAESSKATKDLMEVDEDPSFATSSTSRIAIPGESIASMQDWMR